MLVKIILECWNVRGLGGRQKRDDVKAAVGCNLPSILCLQETKLTDISAFTASSFLPPSLRSFVFKPSVGSSGGIITAWDDRLLELTHHSIDEFSVSTTFSHRSDDLLFTIVNVYGPCTHPDKPIFLSSLEQIFPSFSGPVAFLGDFNLVRSPCDKSNGNINTTEAASFNDFINNLGLLEIPLLDRQFTWSNQQSPPILARLDRVLINPEWSFALPDSTLTSSPRPTSDHVPIHLEASSKAPRSTVFRMENSWLSHSAFPYLVTSNWNSVGPNHSHLSPVSQLCLRLKRVRAAARAWARERRLPSIYLLNCRSVISFLDRLEEHRTLSPLEQDLRSLAKTHLSQKNFERATYWRQRAKIKNCTLGDENSRYFHLCASGRLQKNQIKNLEADNGNLTSSHTAKATILHTFLNPFLAPLCRPATTSTSPP
ncbi:uncharacterized protein [Lolium perenne]|uniref:uncharacterized protein n=1 Tax=Lolium perenne TaxID=4522 RepID=UPI003A99797B